MKTNKSINKKNLIILTLVGLFGAVIILIGDFLMGWGVRNESIQGIEGYIYQYLTLSDSRMFWAAILGVIGVPITTIGHFAFYKIIKQYTQKHAKIHAIGSLGFLTFGGAGVHVSSIATAFFYKYMKLANPDNALNLSIKFACYFPLPLYIALFICAIILSYVQIKTIASGLSPFPRWGWIFSMPIGAILVTPVIFFGNHPIVNSLMVGALSIGNIWYLCGFLYLISKTKQININLENNNQ